LTPALKQIGRQVANIDAMMSTKQLKKADELQREGLTSQRAIEELLAEAEAETGRKKGARKKRERSPSLVEEAKTSKEKAKFKIETAIVEEDPDGHV
jgi:hypothetical protein